MITYLKPPGASVHHVAPVQVALGQTDSPSWFWPIAGILVALWWFGREEERENPRRKNCRAFLGSPDIIREMAYGGTRYKYLHGLRIDHVADEGVFVVHQAGVAGELGRASTLAAAKRIACERGEA